MTATWASVATNYQTAPLWQRNTGVFGDAACNYAGYDLSDIFAEKTGFPIPVFTTPAGVPLRLRADTARAVNVAADNADVWGKVRVNGAVAHDTLPLAAIYLLQPMCADAAVSRVPRPTRAAALALLAHGKITALLGGEAGGEALSRCVELAHGADVYDLAIPRDLARLHDVTAQLLAWHTSPSLTAGRAT